MAMNNLGRVAMVHRGDYSPTYDYKPLDCCYRDGSTYFCKAATTGNAPPNTTYWVLMSTSASTVDRDAAEAAAQAAASSATSAANQVTLAEEQVTLAQGHANTASTKATAAAGSASAAADSAGQALASEGNASVSASAAAQSAASAADSAALVDMTNYALKTQITNPNILHNWDFRNPVNQRDLSTASGAGYWLDRWTLNQTTGATYTYGLSGLHAITTTDNVTMRQYIENPNAYAEKTVTLSVDIYAASVTAGCSIRLWYNGNNQAGALVIENGDTGIKSITATIPDTALTDLSVAFFNYAGNDVRIKSIKLELGTVSTLANDPPMDHAVELLKCQRFLYRVPTGYIPLAYAHTTSTLYLFFQTPAEMRILPSVIYEPGSSFSLRYIGTVSAISWDDVIDVSKYGMGIRLAVSGSYTAYHAAGGSIAGAPILFSSEL